MARLLSFLLALGSLAAAGSSASADWSADLLALPAPVTDVRQAGDTVYIKADSWFQVSICDHREICLMPGEPPAIARQPDGIPDGTIAAASRLDTVRAWYSEPTDRYGHGILGDRVEAGALVAVDAAGRRYTMSLGPGFAFEDLAPRIVDLDEDRMAEIVTIRTDINAGAAIAIYGIRDGGLAEIAATEPIRMPNRWLNIAGIADLTGDGRLDIALVKTPHIGGRLEVWTFRSGSLTRLASAEGFSNHIIAPQNSTSRRSRMPMAMACSILPCRMRDGRRYASFRSSMAQFPILLSLQLMAGLKLGSASWAHRAGPFFLWDWKMGER